MRLPACAACNDQTLIRHPCKASVPDASCWAIWRTLTLVGFLYDIAKKYTEDGTVAYETLLLVPGRTSHCYRLATLHLMRACCCGDKASCLA